MTLKETEPDLNYNDYIHKVTKFFNIAHFYTHTKSRLIDYKSYAGREKLWSVYLGREERHFPPVVICDVDGYVNNRHTELSLAVVDEPSSIRDHVMEMPIKFRERLRDKLSIHGYMGESEDYNALIKYLGVYGIFLMPIPKLRDTSILKEIDWPDFVDELTAWKCVKDPRLQIVHKAHLSRGVEPRLNPHGLEFTNGGTGKTEFYRHVGANYDKATPKSFLGYAKSPDEIYVGTIDSSELPVSLDQIESGSYSIMRYLFNAMESGEGRVSAGATDFLVKTKSCFTILGNPIGYHTDPAKSFGQLVDHISNNPAIGRRFGIIVYGTDYQRLKPEVKDLTEWDKALTFYRAVEEYALPELRNILNAQETWHWLRADIGDYEQRVRDITSTIENETVRTFLREHAGGGQHRLRAAALNVSIIENLDKIALKTYALDEILEGAQDYLNNFVEINLESIINIVRSLEEEIKHYAQSYFKNSPLYLQEIISAVEHYRRGGSGEVTFKLRSLNYIPENNPPYNYFSKCIDKLLKRKKIDGINEKCQAYYRFSIKRIGNDIEVFLLDLNSCEYIEPIGNFTISPVSPFHESVETLDDYERYTNVQKNGIEDEETKHSYSPSSKERVSKYRGNGEIREIVKSDSKEEARP